MSTLFRLASLGVFPASLFCGFVGVVGVVGIGGTVGFGGVVGAGGTGWSIGDCALADVAVFAGFAGFTGTPGAVALFAPCRLFAGVLCVVGAVTLAPHDVQNLQSAAIEAPHWVQYRVLFCLFMFVPLLSASDHC